MKNMVTVLTLILAICFLGLGICFKSMAKQYEGLSISSGAYINGQYVEISSGKIASNSEKYESYNETGTAFYVFAGISGFICVISAVSGKKQ